MKRFLYLLIGIFFITTAHAQISGVVLDEHGEPLVGANVYWAGTGVGVATDLDGNFTLMPVKTTNRLVASFVGCHNDTTVVLNREPLTIVLVDEAVLDEVTITERKMGVIKSRTSAFDTQTMGTEELCRAACCNLSEAFETNASVDVAYADAATGAKQIRLLGLSGTYVQLLQENTPAVRGLAQNFGMEYIPGPWMSSVQVSKGTSSVINGYEAVSGQINVELLKPQTQNPLSLNLMFNSELMAEANIEGGFCFFFFRRCFANDFFLCFAICSNLTNFYSAHIHHQLAFDDIFRRSHSLHIFNNKRPVCCEVCEVGTVCHFTFNQLAFDDAALCAHGVGFPLCRYQHELDLQFDVMYLALRFKGFQFLVPFGFTFAVELDAECERLLCVILATVPHTHHPTRRYRAYVTGCPKRFFTVTLSVTISKPSCRSSKILPDRRVMP